MTTSRRGRYGACAWGMLCTLPLCNTSVAGQSADASLIVGRIISSQGRPIEAATVDITELGLVVITNASGRYTISIPAPRTGGQPVTLRARAIGFKSQLMVLTVRAGSQTADMTLEADINRLEEMIITGVTGSTSRRDVPFTVYRLTAADMPVPAADPLRQLSGKVAGAHVASYSGRPGGQPDVLLRGPKSLNASGRGQSPLFIVDGVIINGALPDMNPQDIESIEVVSGAAAATLYGSRSGNGVIQITTKRGLAGAGGAQFRVRSEYGQSDIPSNFPLSTRTFLLVAERADRFCARVSGNLDCARTVDLNEEALRINEQAPGAQALTPQLFVHDFSLSAAPTKSQSRGLFQNTAWPRQYDAMAAAITGGAYATLALDMAGRSSGIGYFASASAFRQEAPFVSLDGFRRQTLRVNLDHQAAERWQFGLSMGYSSSESGAANMDDGAGFRNLLRVPAGVDLTRRDIFAACSCARIRSVTAGTIPIRSMSSRPIDRRTKRVDSSAA